jgi:hypothetical protein
MAAWRSRATFRTCNRPIKLKRCAFTVCTLMPSCLAISGQASPSQINGIICAVDGRHVPQVKSRLR